MNGFLLAAALAFGALATGCKPAPVEFPGAAAGQLEIQYPLDETLFPPDIVAPSVTWKDAQKSIVDFYRRFSRK